MEGVVHCCKDPEGSPEGQSVMETSGHQVLALHSSKSVGNKVE